MNKNYAEINKALFFNRNIFLLKMVSTSINRPKQKVHKNHQRLARLKKQRSKANKKATEYIIPDADIMPKSHLRKHLKHPQNNAEMSGKKKRKVLKMLRRKQAGSSKMMEVEAEEGPCKVEVEEKAGDVEMEAE